MNRTKFAVGSLIGAVAIHVGLIACGVRPAAMPDVIADAIQFVTDAEVRDAQAQNMPMQATCEAVTNGTSTSYFATFMVPGFDPSRAGEVTSRACGIVCTNQSCSVAGTAFGVPAGATCQNTSMWMRTDRIDVYCGVAGDHASTARVWIH